MFVCLSVYVWFVGLVVVFDGYFSWVTIIYEFTIFCLEKDEIWLKIFKIYFCNIKYMIILRKIKTTQNYNFINIQSMIYSFKFKMVIIKNNCYNLKDFNIKNGR